MTQICSTLVLYCTRKEETAKLLTRLTTAGGKAVKDILKVEELDLEGMCHEEHVLGGDAIFQIIFIHLYPHPSQHKITGW